MPKENNLIPGLAEMHAHVPPVDNLEPMKEVLTLFLANGITTIRGMLGHPRHLELRDKIRSGEITGPRFYTTGPSFNGNSVKTPAQCEALVREHKKAGYDYLKLHPGLTKENFAAMAKTAKEVNIPFVGHVSFDVGVWQAIDAGYSSIDHLDGFVEGMVPGIEQMNEQQTGLFGMFIADKVDQNQMPKLMKGLKEKNIWVVPTQALAERWFSSIDPEQLNSAPEMKYMSREVRDNWVKSKKNLQANAQYDPAKMKQFIELRRKLINECQKNGVGLLLRCDAPQVFNVPGFSTHHELKYMVDSGLTPYEALRTGTVNVATYLNKSAQSGTIKTGNVSDLVLLNGNPLTDISQTTQIAGVMIGNLWLSKEYIDRELKNLEK
ncbi:amidohydrolase family protein [Rhodocytophaga rosea]|uniref:amidohydrolase family protein n=1 Tax=Rhodocytophaga rosea TaxID=2704465 RepID=UPI00293BE5B3|nr:amidohydrolase family protein [Rhodocytophaga rosea]